MSQVQSRRTKRRYAYELYPSGPEDGTTRPLAEDVPYLIARAMGYTVDGTSWMEVEPRSAAGARVGMFLEAARVAFLADALHQDMVGQEAWEWADARTNEEADEFLWERAEHYGIDPALIKPYPCGPEPSTHDHMTDMVTRSGRVTRIPIPESECVECTEPIDDLAAAAQ